ncbi:uncharacterized protein LOC124157722 [Ischnura elegans]|uniref:uncharacterized protein LOC124157722 n=1 Tax=Ischnura elegans TaxID=197161 RepID=UPI001ED8790D|nr:uncharacterized protein LOC124157722 [Ischnura elegans]
MEGSESHKPDKTLIVTLKIQDKKYKKWRKYRALGLYLRKSKKLTFEAGIFAPADKELGVSEDSEGNIAKGYQISQHTPLEARRVARVKDRQYPLHKRLTHRTSISYGSSERIKVNVEDIIVPAKTDIDPGFFTTIEGRPIARQYKRREYLQRQAELLLTKASIINISENIHDMKEKLDDKLNTLSHAEKCLPFHKKQSWNSVYKDFEKTAKVHERQREARKKLLDARQKKKKLQALVHIARCNLYNLEEHWRLLKSYQEFLYRVSPLQWRKKHDRIHVEENKLTLAQMPAGCDRYHINSIDPTLPLEELVQFFYSVNAEDKPPELYFTDPKELKDYFHYMEELNANIMSNAMKLQKENKHLNKFFKDLKHICQLEVQKFRRDYDNLVEEFTVLENKKRELQELAMREKLEVTTIILNDSHVDAQALITSAYNMLLNPTKLNIGLSSILNNLSNEVSTVLWEISNLPPTLLKRLIIKEEEGLHKAELADQHFRKVKRYEKQVKDIFFRRIIAKHRKGLKLRSEPLPESEKEVETPMIKFEQDIYTEDIFTQPIALEEVPEYLTDEYEIKPWESETSLKETVHESEESNEPSKVSEPSFLKQSSSPKSQDSVLSSMGLEDGIKYSKESLVALIPNKTLELPQIEPKLQPFKVRSWPVKKPSLVVTDTTKRKISLLTNYDKSFSVAETERDTREMSFVDVVKTTKIRDNLMRWKSIFPAEKEKISKSNLFHVGKTSIPDPFLSLIQEKMKRTSRKWFALKSDVIRVSPLIHSSYFPSLPTIAESEPSDKSTMHQIDSILPMLDNKLRECKIRYYFHKASCEDKYVYRTS